MARRCWSRPARCWSWLERSGGGGAARRGTGTPPGSRRGKSVPAGGGAVAGQWHFDGQEVARAFAEALNAPTGSARQFSEFERRRAGSADRAVVPDFQSRLIAVRAQADADLGRSAGLAAS